jgi:hypothetical protein
MGSELSWQFWIHLLTALCGDPNGNGCRALGYYYYYYYYYFLYYYESYYDY